ncbi:PaaI family thioesterase [Verminephrobacter aporrectodeae]|uniref:PaaI family thioesterase n=1 Tax=Verminephrobacter aporrectodeae subsp. tuberculatae TaxID=1110392 RepID=A0ABT3KQ22_9BURK|nr:PaaI family thioesterase [Verminephrobacter aporrectodeae]MCW5220617.1 PaaI family thioesterase [Verminephrobacter aporrectodeae subsp. tuberculatae]MCW5255428.1 PaaI family thioesterase [Verminephrobacter aporrectodeae subsp. tuberculatae]MCW5289912.1 PaaI family thioesterase [Verminephrobacter aporrectodeae subsp. tuberculatae]MCW5320412.1 PaaI family thioesterase [Verminephrobacter aporrectodeae subsp. tuberculatae]MCW8166303.1 PaaI family thioesterase [Verminephrobacter aporrectodeae su
MNDTQKFARQVFDSQPFSLFIGAELTASSSDSAELTLVIKDHHKQQHGYAHGGVISYLADNAITFAGGLALGGNALTVEFKINYLRPGVGDRLVARAQTRSTGKRLAICQCEVFAVDSGVEKLCALAQGTIVPAN